MSTISLNTGTQFAIAEGQSLLEAARQANIPFPYSCKTGRCSSCKCKVISGTTSAFQDEIGLSVAEKTDGWILACVRSAVSNVTLEVEDLLDTVLPSVKKLPCRIHALEKLCHDVLKVTLRIPPSESIQYFAGQYIDVTVPAGLRRSYSLACASAESKLLELHIRFVPEGGMSDYWFNRARLNDLLWLQGPLGTFFLREVAGRDLIFLATGTGFAPVKAILESLGAFSADAAPRSVAVYWGGRTREDLYWNVESSDRDFEFVPVLSRAGPDWMGARGYVQDVLTETKQEFERTVVYACGSPSMIHGARDLLVSRGLPPRSFYSDAFVCSASTSS